MEIFINILRHGIFITLAVFIFFYFLQNRKAYSFVRGVFLTSCSFIVVSDLLILLSFYLRIEFMRNIFGFDGSLGFIQQYLGSMGYFLIFFGITFLINKEFSGKEGTEAAPPVMQGKKRNIGFSLLLFAVTLGIYTIFWLYRTVKDLKNNFDADIPYTPGKAVGYLFIPIFNIYWLFYILFSLPLRMKRIEDKYYGKAIGFHFHPVLITILFIIFLILANLLQIEFSFGNQIVARTLFFLSAIWALWLTIQAKLNAFFDASSQVAETK